MTNQEARAAAVVAVRQQQGLTGIPPANWTYEQRTAYNKALAAYILTRPAGFTADDAGTAAHVQNRTYAPLDDTSFDWGMFGDETLKNANDVAQGFKFTLGTGVILAVVALVVLGFFRYAPERSKAS